RNAWPNGTSGWSGQPPFYEQSPPDALPTASCAKAASKLYREIYGEKPKLKYSRLAKRNHVHRYPCGILEQAYRQLKDQGCWDAFDLLLSFVSFFLRDKFL